MIPMRELTDQELDAVCGGRVSIRNSVILNRVNQINRAVVVKSKNISIDQSNSIDIDN